MTYKYYEEEEDDDPETYPPPQYQSRGWKVPRELVFELEDKKTITAEEFILLCRIENLVQYGKGCYATNRWLANLQNCTIRRIQQLLHELKRKKLVFERYGKVPYSNLTDGRWLWTKWSEDVKERIEEERRKKTKKHRRGA